MVGAAVWWWADGCRAPGTFLMVVSCVVVILCVVVRVVFVCVAVDVLCCDRGVPK